MVKLKSPHAWPWPLIGGWGGEFRTSSKRLDVFSVMEPWPKWRWHCLLVQWPPHALASFWGLSHVGHLYFTINRRDTWTETYFSISQQPPVTTARASANQRAPSGPHPSIRAAACRRAPPSKWFTLFCCLASCCWESEPSPFSHSASLTSMTMPAGRTPRCTSVRPARTQVSVYPNGPVLLCYVNEWFVPLSDQNSWS